MLSRVGLPGAISHSNVTCRNFSFTSVSLTGELTRTLEACVGVKVGAFNSKRIGPSLQW